MQAQTRTTERDRLTWLRHLILLLLIAAAFAALDLWVKQLAFDRLGAGEEVAVLPHFLYLQTAHNTGGLFGIGREHTWLFILLSSLTMALVVGVYFAIAREHWLTRFALGLVLGGAAGNLWDRIQSGYVRDFILIRVGRFQWPNFNLADVWISVGALLLVYWMLKHPREKNIPNGSH